MKLCNHENCGGKYYARGMCVKHYSKWMRSVAVRPTKPNARELVLSALPGTSAQIATATDLCIGSVREWIRKLRGTEVYVARWKKEGNLRLAVYARGAKKDKPCTIPAMTSAEYSKRHRAAHLERVRQRQRTYYALQKAKSRKATWASALGVAA